MDLKTDSNSSAQNSKNKQTVARTNTMSSPETFVAVMSVSNCETTVTECSETHETVKIESQELTCRAHFILHDFTQPKIKKTYRYCSELEILMTICRFCGRNRGMNTPAKWKVTNEARQPSSGSKNKSRYSPIYSQISNFIRKSTTWT